MVPPPPGVDAGPLEVRQFLEAFFFAGSGSEEQAAATAAKFGWNGVALYGLGERRCQELFGDMGKALFWELQDTRYNWACFTTHLYGYSLQQVD